MMNWLPENISLEGKEVDFFFYVCYYLTSITFILVAITMAVFLIRYRQKPGKKAKYTHGNNTLEIVWTIVPTVILLVFVLMTQASWAKLKYTPPANPDVRVEVVGKQFNWVIIYPGPDKKFGTSDDLKLDNQLNIPVNKQVLITLKGEDVIHSFFIPAVRLKQDILPGKKIPFWFTPIKTGKYEIPCAELCGVGHSGMNGELVVHTEKSYQEWLKTAWSKKEKKS